VRVLVTVKEPLAYYQNEHQQWIVSNTTYYYDRKWKPYHLEIVDAREHEYNITIPSEYYVDDNDARGLRVKMGGIIENTSMYAMMITMASIDNALQIGSYIDCYVIAVMPEYPWLNKQHVMLVYPVLMHDMVVRMKSISPDNRLLCLETHIHDVLSRYHNDKKTDKLIDYGMDI
jgi:hypothetical protein